MQPKAIKLLTDGKIEYYLFYPENSKVEYTFPFSGVTMSNASIQPTIYFGNQYSIRGRKAIRGLLQNIYPQEGGWSDKETMYWISEAADYGWREAIDETLSFSRVMVGIGYTDKSGSVIINEIMPSPPRQENDCSSVGEVVSFPWRTKNGLEWIECMAVKTQNPIVFTPLYKWVRFYDRGCFISNEVSRLNALPAYHWQVSKTTDRSYAECHSEELIKIQKQAMPTSGLISLE